ncbi:YopT-type cysteine protease domain-containing protein [Erwinia sp. BNK-24-b]
MIIFRHKYGRHAVALTLRKGNWVFFDPNFGSFLCDKGIFEFVVFLESIYSIVDFFALKIIKKNRFPLEKTVFSRYGQRISSEPALQGMTSAHRPEADVPVPARRRSIAPAPAPRRGAPVPTSRRSTAPVPAPRHGAPVPASRRSTAPVPAPRHGAPVPAPRRSIAPVPVPRHGAPAPAPRSSAVPVPALRKTFQGR